LKNWQWLTFLGHPVYLKLAVDNLNLNELAYIYSAFNSLTTTWSEGSGVVYAAGPVNGVTNVNR